MTILCSKFECIVQHKYLDTVWTEENNRLNREFSCSKHQRKNCFVIELLLWGTCWFVSLPIGPLTLDATITDSMTATASFQIWAGFLTLEAATENRRITRHFQVIQQDQFVRNSITWFVLSVVQYRQLVHDETRHISVISRTSTKLQPLKNN